MREDLQTELHNLMADGDFALGIVYQINNTVTVDLSVGRKFEDPRLYAYEVQGNGRSLEQALEAALTDLWAKRGH